METSLYDRLDEPQTFEEMTIVISHPEYYNKHMSYYQPGIATFLKGYF